MTGEIQTISIDQLVELVANSSPAILLVCEKIPALAAQLISKISKSGSLLIEVFHISPSELVDKHIIEKEQLTELVESKGGLCLVYPLGLGLTSLKLSYLMTSEQEAELMMLISKSHSSLMSSQPGI